LVPFLNEVAPFRGAQSYQDVWNEPGDYLQTRFSLDERSPHRRSTSRQRNRRPSPPSAKSDYLAVSPPRGATSRYSTTSNLTIALGGGSRFSPYDSQGSMASGESSLTDDSGSASSLGADLMTPPTTPPSSDFPVGSPRTRSKDTWRKMTGSLGWKKKSSSGMRDSRFPTIEDEENI